jgi:hypothetical protein
MVCAGNGGVYPYEGNHVLVQPHRIENGGKNLLRCFAPA